VGLASAGVADQAERVAAADPVPGDERVDRGGVDVRVGVEVEVPEPHLPREPRRRYATDHGSAVAVAAFGQEQLGEEALLGELLAFGGLHGFIHDGTHRRQPQPPAGLVGRGDLRLPQSSHVAGADWS
jgi:hypothetical protein